MNLTDYARPNIRALKPYSTARDEFKGGAEISAWLDANESPYNNGVNRYPDPHQRALKARIGEIFGMAENSIFIGGAGSDEAIDLCFRVFCEPGADNAIAITPSYGVYGVAADINNVELRQVQLNPDFSLPAEALLQAADGRSKLLFLCSPNNPTGSAFPEAEILELARSFNGMVVVDEAYADFSTKGTMLTHIAAHPNLLVLRTFSKAWGMAGMRAGMAFGAPEVIELFNRVKYPYNMSAPIQAELMRRLEQGPEEQVAEICGERDRLADALARCPEIVKVYPSDANFLLVETTDANALYDKLMANGILVRNRSSMPGCHNCLRITVGTPEENRKLIRILNEKSIIH